jgi:hypothetical protein
LSVVQQPSSSGLVARVTGMLKAPAAEWDVIDGESATVQGLFTGYACILAAIPAIIGLVASLLLATMFASMAGPFSHFPGMAMALGLGPVGAIVRAVLGYVAGLATIFAVGFIADALAPSFDGQRSQIQGMKLAVYSPTASWVSGLALIVPVLGGLVALAGLIYSIYTLWIGAPKLMKVPAEKAMGFNIVLILAWIVIAIVVGFVVSSIVGMMFISSAIATGGLVR